MSHVMRAMCASPPFTQKRHFIPLMSCSGNKGHDLCQLPLTSSFCAVKSVETSVPPLWREIIFVTPENNPQWMREFYYTDLAKGHKFHFLPRLVQFHLKKCAQSYVKKKGTFLPSVRLSSRAGDAKVKLQKRKIFALPWASVRCLCRSWWRPGTSASWSSSSPPSSSTWWRTSSTRSLLPTQTRCGGARWVRPDLQSTDLELRRSRSSCVAEEVPTRK